jgi:response regulator RpfG family c-di-GMP phosphodiesterase
VKQEDPVYHALFTYTKALSVALGYRDMMTRLHSERVRALAMELGRRLGLRGKELDALNISASFHDIGKIGIPDAVLLKHGRLNEAEWEMIRQHSEIGERIMTATELAGAPEAAQIIRHHHEHYDGQGYPDGLAGEVIPLASRIISVVDSYDAMAVTRVYHRTTGHAEIMEILRDETGKKHDPEIMRLFTAMIECSPHRAAAL